MLKRILISLSVLVVLVITIPALYLYQLNTDEIKQKLSALLSSSTHHQIIFNGDLHWRLLPTIHLVVNDVSITPQRRGSNIQGKVGQLSFTLDTWDLLYKKLTFKQIHLNDADLIMNISASTPTNTHSQSVRMSEKSEHNGLALTLNQISLKNSAFTIISNKDHISLTKVNLKLKQHGKSQAIKVESNINIKQPNQNIVVQGIRVSGTVTHLDKIINNPSSLTTLAMDATIKAKHLSIARLSIDDMSATLSINSGIIQLKPYRFELADGTVTGTLRYDLPHDVLTIKQKLTNVDTSNLLEAYNSHDKFISGRLNLDWQSKSHPVDQNILYHTQASGSLTYDNTLVDLPSTLNTIETIVRSLPKLVSQNSSSLEEQFQLTVLKHHDGKLYQQMNQGSLTANFQLHNGIVAPIHFKLSHPKLSATGELSLNLKNQQMLGNMKLVTSSHDRNIQKAQALLNGSFPFVIKGDLSDLKLYPNMAAITPILINQFVNQEGKKVIQQLGNQLLNKVF